MLTRGQEKLIKSLHTKKGRSEHGLCLVEGEKNIESARAWIDFTFTRNDTIRFDSLVTTDSPQERAAVARIPTWKTEDLTQDLLVVLDGVQDPGNVGTILRLCLGFDAGLILTESADPSNSKVIRSAAGAFFQLPWIAQSRAETTEFLVALSRPVYRLENREGALSTAAMKKPCVLIAGSEGSGIQIEIEGTSVRIEHNPALESLNVANALAITLHALWK